MGLFDGLGKTAELYGNFKAALHGRQQPITRAQAAQKLIGQAGLIATTNLQEAGNPTTQRGSQNKLFAATTGTS